MEFKKKVNKHKELALEVMELNEESRNNDWVLIFDALSLSGVSIDTDTIVRIKKSGVNVHTLVRERRKIQSTGLFLPTNPEVEKRRRLRAADYAEHYSN
jgi:hypothetical protein